MRTPISVFLLLVVFSFSLLSVSCSKKDCDEFDNPLHINICVLGNSYSNDAFSYVPFILKQYGITCSLHIYYRSSGSLKNLDEEWKGGRVSTYHFYIDTRINDRWKYETGQSASQVLSYSQWDIVSLQQYSRHVKYEETYSPYLENIIKRIEYECQYKPRIAWFMAYNRADDDSLTQNLITQQRIVEGHDFDIIFPVATAIFNCQASSRFSTIGDSHYGRMYSSDDIHLQEGLPCYVASLAIVESLLRELSLNESVWGDKVRPTQAWIESIGGITPNGKSVGVSDTNCMLAQRAAINANDDYFVIIPID